MRTNSITRFVMFVLALTASIALPLSQASAEQANAQQAEKPTAVYYHADWCPNCQALSPKFQQAVIGFEDDLNILVMDYTDEETNSASLNTAMKMGLFETVINNRHTGFVLLLDDKGNEKGRLFRVHSVDEIRKSLQALADA